MNIFILDENIKKSAEYQVDKHCVKMLLEQCQLLCNSARFYDRNCIVPYKETHLNHPCDKWLKKDYNNYLWLIAYTHELYLEYKYRYNKNHLSYTKLKEANIITDEFISLGAKLNIKDLSPSLAMPVEVQNIDPVISYRNYYNTYKKHLFKWTKRNISYWINGK